MRIALIVLFTLVMFLFCVLVSGLLFVGGHDHASLAMALFSLAPLYVGAGIADRNR